jgi:hypothetical protein
MRRSRWKFVGLVAGLAGGVLARRRRGRRHAGPPSSGDLAPPLERTVISRAHGVDTDDPGAQWADDGGAGRGGGQSPS